MTADLVAFLRRMLDTDEQVARAAEGNRAFDGTGTIPDLISTVAIHIARHDPARVLAEVAAKRAIVDHIADELDATDSPWWYDDKLTFILQQLALPYANHPDYRPEWAPDA